jgi:hypothetical protein
MRTTVNIEEGILKELKRRAVEEKASLGEVLNETLKLVLLAHRATMDDPVEKPLKTFRGSGLQAGVDLTDGRSLREMMEGA